MFKPRGFTIVEIMIVVAVLAILVGITIVSYGAWQTNIAKSSVKSDLELASSGLENYQIRNDSYSRNMAGTGFVSSDKVSIVPYTNATVSHVALPYSALSSAQNVELFLYSCNAEMQNLSRTCSLIGNGNGAKVHVPGTGGSNTQWRGDICTSSGSGCQTVLTSDCDGVPLASCQTIVNSFTTQGGSFPIFLSAGRANLPTQPSEEVVDETVPITKYCIEGRAVSDNSVVYHITSTNKATIVTGACPSDPELNYFPE